MRVCVRACVRACVRVSEWMSLFVSERASAALHVRVLLCFLLCGSVDYSHSPMRVSTLMVVRVYCVCASV